MKRIGDFASLVMGLAVVGVCAATAAGAAPKTKVANVGKPGKPAAAAKAPMASAAELNKIKGDFKWGMTLDEVAAVVQKRIEASFADRLEKAANDPTRQDRVRREMRGEVDGIKKRYTKFDGVKSGYDVSIIDQEFSQNTSESMLLAKEETATRYFFFAYDKLYKMFIAFDKEMLQGKSFAEFGGMMQGRFGKAREVFVEEKSKAGVKKKLDHYMWSSKAGDTLRLVDRSEFYDVYCLVIYDGQVDARLAEAHKANAKGPAKLDPLVDAVTGTPVNALDPNDNVVDRITGKAIRKPGDEQGGNITVPLPAPQSPK